MLQRFSDLNLNRVIYRKLFLSGSSEYCRIAERNFSLAFWFWRILGNRCERIEIPLAYRRGPFDNNRQHYTSHPRQNF